MREIKIIDVNQRPETTCQGAFWSVNDFHRELFFRESCGRCDIDTALTAINKSTSAKYTRDNRPFLDVPVIVLVAWK